MKKYVSQFLSVILALALILSMSVVVLAANGYQYTVTRQTTSTSQTEVSPSPKLHVKGTADTIEYTVSGRTYTFDTTIFPVTYREELMDSYIDAGFVDVLTINPASGTKTISSGMVSGTYVVVLNYCHGSGTWAVGLDGALVDGGRFSSAPISYSIDLYKVA